MAWTCPICHQVNDDSSRIHCVCGHDITFDDQKKYSVHIPDDKSKPYPLPAGLIIKDAFSHSWLYRTEITKAIAFPFLGLIVLSFIYDSYLNNFGFFAKIIYELLHATIFTLLAVTCHRLVLLGRESVPKFGILSLSMREVRFFSWIILGVICGYLIMNATKMVAFLIFKSDNWFFVLQVIFIPLWLYIYSRLSVVLPATAIDKKADLAWAWNITKTNGVRLMIISAVIMLSVLLVSVMAVGTVIYFIFNKGALFNLSLSFSGYLAVIVDIIALSFAYKYLTRESEHNHLMERNAE